MNVKKVREGLIYRYPVGQATGHWTIGSKSERASLFLLVEIVLDLLGILFLTHGSPFKKGLCSEGRNTLRVLWILLVKDKSKKGH